MGDRARPLAALPDERQHRCSSPTASWEPCSSLVDRTVGADVTVIPVGVIVWGGAPSFPTP
jgi:hypothetical protein